MPTLPYWRLSAVYFAYHAAIGVFTPYFARWMEGLGHGALAISSLFALWYGTRIFGPPLFAHYARGSTRPKAWLLGGLWASAVFFLGFFGAEHLWLLGLSMAAFSLCYNAILPQLEAFTLAGLGPRKHDYGRVRLWGSLGFILLAVGSFIAIVGFLLLTIPFVGQGSAIYPLYRLIAAALVVLGIVLALAGVGLAIYGQAQPKDNPPAIKTGEFLSQIPTLDGRYSFIRNINQSGLGYIDAVLIGPPGVLVFRITDLDGTYGNEAARWLKQRPDNTWEPVNRSFTEEAVIDVNAFRKYLAKRGMAEVPVYGVVVFTSDQAALIPREPVVPVTLLRDILDNLENNYLSRLDRVSQPTVTTIRRLLLS